MEQTIAKRINEELGINVNVENVTVTKNNGVVLHGFNIRKDGEMVAPTIYYEEGWEEDKIVDVVTKGYAECNKRNDTKKLQEHFTELFDDLNNIYSNVIPCVVSRSNAEDLDMRGIIHDSYFDMEIMYRIKIDDLNNTIGTTILSKPMVEHYDIDMNLIREHASKNLRDSLVINTMKNTLVEMCERIGKDPSEFDDVSEETANYMYMISTQSTYYGASAIMLEDVLKDMHDRLGTDEIYIIPSSIHEVIVLPKVDEDDEQTQYLKELINSINATEVAPEDRLTDSLYIHRADGKMTIV